MGRHQWRRRCRRCRRRRRMQFSEPFHILILIYMTHYETMMMMLMMMPVHARNKQIWFAL